MPRKPMYSSQELDSFAFRLEKIVESKAKRGRPYRSIPEMREALKRETRNHLSESVFDQVLNITRTSVGGHSPVLKYKGGFTTARLCPEARAYHSSRKLLPVSTGVREAMIASVEGAKRDGHHVQAKKIEHDLVLDHQALLMAVQDLYEGRTKSFLRRAFLSHKAQLRELASSRL